MNLFQIPFDPSECNRCRRECEPLVDDVIMPWDEELQRYLCADVIDLPPNITLGEALKRMKPEGVDCKKYAKGVVCTESLALYCPIEDIIYYNADRIYDYIMNIRDRSVTIFLLQLRGASELAHPAVLRPFQNLTIAEVRERMIKGVKRAVLNYLVSHERYHWAGCCDLDEEGKATAFGLYEAYKEGFGSTPTQHSISPMRFLKIYAYYLALSIIAFDSWLLKNYRNYVNYIVIPMLPKVKASEIDVVFESNLLRAEIKGGIILQHKSIDKPNIMRSPRQGPLREVWSYCEKPINLKHGPFPI